MKSSLVLWDLDWVYDLQLIDEKEKSFVNYVFSEDFSHMFF